MPTTTYNDFPELMKKLMDYRQKEQTGKIDRSVFEIRRNAAKLRGGFDWDITPEGKNWIRWIYDFDFSHFHTYIEERKDQYAFLFEKVNISDNTVKIFESYLNDNFWIDHVFKENGYPVRVMTKATFLGMIAEMKRLPDNKQLILDKVEEIEKDISVTEITMQIDIGFITEKLNQLKQLL